MRRNISLAVTVAFILVVGLAHYGCSAASDPDELDDSFKPDLANPKLLERLGEDDGYALAVTYGADAHGSLETCG